MYRGPSGSGKVRAEAGGLAASAKHCSRHGRPRPMRQDDRRLRRAGEEITWEGRTSQEGAIPPPERAPELDTMVVLTMSEWGGQGQRIRLAQ